MEQPAKRIAIGGILPIVSQAGPCLGWSRMKMSSMFCLISVHFSCIRYVILYVLYVLQTTLCFVFVSF